MTSLCPSGHQSEADDYCDVCGLPIGAPPARDPEKVVEPVETQAGKAVGAPEPVEGLETADAATPPDATDSTCPNCHAVNPPNALFCEACGYDFTTGSMPRPLDLPPFPMPGATDASVSTPADPSPADDVDTASRPAPSAPSDAPGAPAAPVAPPIESGWVAEVWIDPDWYADQQADDPLPSAGLPAVVPLRSQSLLVGRASQSRGIHPDIDLSSDSGISRRHCQLTTDGRRWWVEDLGSSNGTFVGDATGPLPTTPLVKGQKRELDEDDRIYIGAWTRLVVRRAEPGEV